MIRWAHFETITSFARGHTATTAVIGFVAGVMVWGAFNWSLEISNTETFCISCHVMKENPWPEYRKTRHYANRTGVRASCPDCHVPREWIHKVVRKVRATGELYHWLIGSIDTREKFEARRPFLAEQVWASMVATDSRECRNCHGIESMAAEAQTPGAYAMHQLAAAWEKTCIDCHQGIAHDPPREFDADDVMDALHDRMDDEKIECELCHEKMGRPPPGDDWD
ncbi:MAG: NapC/NirT family cytochrome c [Alphaproteobacteria bacterium]|jgi:cytochrome c-type protein NapC|nr:NapC/NirT family cytochrome c [Alphaproteobacteria bacterium]MDP6515986.1 NapC/NirT family cytochrome c [Alphaproteobacteria bacterium]